MSPSIRGPAVPRRRLGAELRHLREEAGLLIEDIAKVLECSASKISRLENGKGIPRTRDIRDMLTAYGVTDSKVRDRLLGWASAGRQQGWWQDFTDVIRQESLTDHLDTYIAFEADAIRKLEFQGSVIPGLLQTEKYARAVLEVFPFDYSPSHVNRLVELRLRRQEVLHREDLALELQCVIDESVLLRPVGGRETMIAQLEKIKALFGKSNIKTAVLPLSAGEHAAIIGSFELLEFADDTDDDVVIVESITGSAYVEDQQEVMRYRKAFQEVVRKASGSVESIRLIDSAIERFRSAQGAIAG